MLYVLQFSNTIFNPILILQTEYFFLLSFLVITHFETQCLETKSSSHALQASYDYEQLYYFSGAN
jgi:hypothetical protein